MSKEDIIQMLKLLIDFHILPFTNEQFEIIKINIVKDVQLFERTGFVYLTDSEREDLKNCLMNLICRLKETMEYSKKRNKKSGKFIDNTSIIDAYNDLIKKL